MSPLQDGKEPTVAEAREFAIAAHGTQKYGEYPYSFHLDAVVNFLAPYGSTAQIIGYLHDVAEDTSITISEIQEKFGPLVAACVALVTDEKGANRKERKAKTNAKLAKVSQEHQLALIVKAADRLANLRMSLASESDDKLQMYRREHPAFRQAAYRADLCDDIWTEIETIIEHGTK